MAAILSRPQCVNSLRPSDAYMRQLTNHHWFREWLVAWSSPSHYLNQCWNIANWTLRNKLQWNFSRNSNIFIQKNALENVVCVIASISSRHQWVNILCIQDIWVTQGWTLLQLMACHLTSDRLLCTSVLTSCSLSNKEYDSITSYLQFQYFFSKQYIWKCFSAKCHANYFGHRLWPQFVKLPSSEMKPNINWK